MDLDDQICLCFHVSRRKLQNYARTQKPKVASQLSQCGGAGTGCGWCIPFLKQIFRQANEQPEIVPLDTMTADDYARQRADHVKSGKGTPPPGATPVE